ncbi:ethanolamine utilization protein EutJ [Alkaliphilus serpentinus]|uniref:Ethanolamine utilization protein EutJ n=1 Tax=Alkaliphilus serpentinus TaxID=1482731 RepID=A0A833HLA6_9FIRM|nr:ethanolamine utilization protein EutJ [Alkaliphilus serpentinus]KAB3525606.1 ethanolamine utilization protein EutJ [Alkaliphilus serpentinus]
MDFKLVDEFIQDVENSIQVTKGNCQLKDLKVGVDLGTAYIVLVVLDKANNPIACELEFAQVVKDGLVVDYIGALNIVKKLKAKLEGRLGVELTRAAIAVPPGTGEGDCRSHRYVVEGSGMEVTAILDEPTAANAVLNIKDGVVVDIGGGTTGLAIFDKGKVVYIADEATGGTHLSLVIAGNYKINFEEAEEKKKDKDCQREVFTIVVPVIEKMASIIKSHIAGFHVDNIFLVGGTCCLNGIEEIIEKETGIRTLKPTNPFLITPTGIAMHCK